MATNDGLPTEQDFVPPAVRRASEAATAIHQQAYKAPDAPAPKPPAAPAAGADFPVVDANGQPIQQAPAAPQEPPKAPAGQDFVDPASATDIQNDPWASRYNSMQGRWRQAQGMNGQLQEQLGEMGDELLRTQQALALARGARVEQPEPVQQPQQRQPARKLLTEKDVEAYGPELIDFVQRAAKEAVAPDLSQVSQALQQTNQRVTRTTTQSLYTDLDEAVPEWRTLNNDPEFKAWASLRDVYSGVVRGKLMNAAFQAADAPRVAAFFTGYLAERKATGHETPVLQDAATQQQPPRQAAVQLENLTAPGRAKPASGADTGGAAEKPVYTRAQIGQFYSDVRRGVFAGRDADKNATEQAIFLAQREGRVR